MEWHDLGKIKKILKKKKETVCIGKQFESHWIVVLALLFQLQWTLTNSFLPFYVAFA